MGKEGGNACKHSLTELFPPLIDRRPRNCDMKVLQFDWIVKQSVDRLDVTHKPLILWNVTF